MRRFPGFINSPSLGRTLVVTVILLFFIWLSDNSIKNKSVTFDEVAHITAGYSYWKTGDFRLNPQNGVLPQTLAALPLLFLPVSFPETSQNAWQQADVWGLADQFFHRLGNDVQSMLRHSRRMIIAIGVLTGLLVFFWSHRLWGFTGACLSLLLYALSPTILAHTRLATSDMTAAFGFLLATMMIWLLTHKVSYINIFGAGVAVSILALSKMSAVLIIPVALIILTVRRYWGPAPILLISPGGLSRLTIYIATFFLVCLIAITIINLAYISQPADVVFNSNIMDRLPGLFRFPLQLLTTSQLLPESYVYGFAYTLAHTGYRLSFAAGSYSLNGWWWFFPFAFLIKTPLVTLATGILSGVKFYSLTKSEAVDKNQPHPLYHTIPLIILILVYTGFAIASHLNIGHRHLLPVYPPLFILFGVMASKAVSRKLAYTVVIGSLLALETLSNHPHHLAFFNQASGGPENGYRLLVDSSLDWGQDLPSLRNWLEKHDGEPSYLAYFGTARPETYHIASKRLPGFLDRSHEPDTNPLVAGNYVISATLLQLVFQPPEAFGPWTKDQEDKFQQLSYIFGHNAEKLQANAYNPAQYQQYEKLRFGRLCHYLRHRIPDDQIGHSLLVYKINEHDLTEAMSRPIQAAQ